MQNLFALGRLLHGVRTTLGAFAGNPVLPVGEFSSLAGLRRCPQKGRA